MVVNFRRIIEGDLPMSKIVVALGGNALGQSPEEQLELVKGTAKSLVSLIQKGYEVVITMVMDHKSAVLI